MVDLPEAERPVNQTVAPFCLRRSVRSSRVRPACHVMLLSHLLGFVNMLCSRRCRGRWRGRGGARRCENVLVHQINRTHVDIVVCGVCLFETVRASLW